MVHHNFCKSMYCLVKGSKVKVTRHKNIAGVSNGGLVSAGFFQCYTVQHAEFLLPIRAAQHESLLAVFRLLCSGHIDL